GCQVILRSHPASFGSLATPPPSRSTLSLPAALPIFLLLRLPDRAGPHSPASRSARQRLRIGRNRCAKSCSVFLASIFPSRILAAGCHCTFIHRRSEHRPYISNRPRENPDGRTKRGDI